MRLELFDDAWHYLDAWSDLFMELAQLADTNPTPARMTAWLKERGFADVTPRQSPFITP